jgi:FkbM family methyltransferase
VPHSEGKQIVTSETSDTAIMENTSFTSGFYSQNGLKAYIREGTDDFHLLFTPREEKILPHLQMNKGETFVDVGANVGYYCLTTAIENVHNNIKVIAIEAHPETYSALLKNIRCNDLDGDDAIIAVNKAVADIKRDAMMYERHTNDGIKMAGNSSICITFDKKNSILVQCDTLDNILADYGRVDVLKMDIEGAEVMALRGASRVLKELRKIVVEIHGDNLSAVLSILKEDGFEITTIPYELNVYVIGTRPAASTERYPEQRLSN